MGQERVKLGFKRLKYIKIKHFLAGIPFFYLYLPL